ncbi:MAG: hypothetical protein KDD62_13840, partial [Bdellovibrionales bacterium]|nr:hypothetical protein [Bdellovibrionales bacterium]
GNFGSVFKLSAQNGKAYALKVYYQRSSEHDFSGPWSETALGVYVTSKKVYNMPRLCAANPEAGWLLSEFVDESYRNPHHDGPSWASLGILTLDPQRDSDNLLYNDLGQDFRVDFGHLTTDQRSTAPIPNELREIEGSKKPRDTMNIASFMVLFDNHPTGRQYLADHLCWVSKSERLDTLKAMYGYPEMAHYFVQDYFRAEVLSDLEVRPFFDFLMSKDSPELAAHAIFDIRNLPEADARYLLQQWNSRPEFVAFVRYLKNS